MLRPIGATATSAPGRMLKKKTPPGVRGELVQSLAPIVRPASKLGGGQPRKAAVLLPIRESHTRLLARPMQPAGGDVGAPVGTASPDRPADAANLVGITCRQHAARATGAHVPVLRKLWG